MLHYLSAIRAASPIVHCITNYVTANDCANLLLACGARPVMADAPEEAAEITAGSQALVLNLGTLSKERFSAMLTAGKQANQLEIPVVFDPVGAGASAFRSACAERLLREIRFAAIRGNPAEMQALAGGKKRFAGIDAAPEDTENAPALAQTLAERYQTVIMLTGETDNVTDGKTLIRIRSGHPVLRQITGAGCMLSALTGAFLTAERSAESCAAAALAVGLAGQTAAEQTGENGGNASCRNHLIDAVYRMTDAELEKGAHHAYLS